MEPEEDILGGPGGGADELRTIVARAGRYRRRSVVVLAAGVAVTALAAGGAIGYVLSDHPARTQTVTAGNAAPAGSPSPGQSAGGTVSPAGGVSAVIGGGVVYGGLGSLQHLFTRTAGQVTVRVYATAPVGTSTTTCGVRSEVIADTSTPRVAGSAIAEMLTPASGAPAVWMMSERLGQAEGSPVDVVMVHTTGEVSKVAARFTDGSAVTDQMVPVRGWSVLTAALPAATSSQAKSTAGIGVATVRVYAASGQVTQMTETLGQAEPMPAVCGCAQPAVGGGTATGGTATGGTATGGTVTGGTASAGAPTDACLPCPMPNGGTTPKNGSVPTTPVTRTGAAASQALQPFCEIFGGTSGTARSGAVPSTIRVSP